MQNIQDIAIFSEGGSKHAELVKSYASVLAMYATKDLSFTKDFSDMAIYHDIGMTKIPEHIVHKKGPLTENEEKILQSHVNIGKDIIGLSARPFLGDAGDLGANMAKYHHEHFDGSGYPEGLQGKNIPYEARLMALVDTYDQLSKKSPEEAFAFIREQSGKQFDPELVQVMERARATLSRLTRLYQEKQQQKQVAQAFTVAEMPVYLLENGHPVFTEAFLEKIRDYPADRQEKLKQYALMNDAPLLSVALEYAGNPSVSLPEAELSAVAQQMYALLPKQVAANECRQLFTPHQPDDTDIATSNIHFQLVQ